MIREEFKQFMVYRAQHRGRVQVRMENKCKEQAYDIFLGRVFEVLISSDYQKQEINNQTAWVGMSV